LPSFSQLYNLSQAYIYDQLEPLQEEEEEEEENENGEGEEKKQIKWKVSRTPTATRSQR